jgi:hypothetical protein
LQEIRGMGRNVCINIKIIFNSYKLLVEYLKAMHWYSKTGCIFKKREIYVEQAYCDENLKLLLKLLFFLKDHQMKKIA